MTLRIRSRNVLSLVGQPGLRRYVGRARKAGLQTLLDYQRLAALVAAVRYVRELPGDVIELGSYRGGSAAVLLQALARSGKKLHVCDSFRGMPEITSVDNYHKKGDFADTSEEHVRSGLSVLGSEFEIHSGFFHDTLPSLSSSTFCLCHIDADLYSSVLTSLEFVYPRMSKGGIIVFDDYGAPTCKGAKLAVDEFFHGRLEQPGQLAHPQWGVIVGFASSDISRQLLPLAGFWTNLFSRVGLA